MAPNNSNAAPASARGSVPGEVKALETIPSESVQIDGTLYSAQKLASFHPGGEVFVRAFAGFDATEAFLSYHRREFPHARMSEYTTGKKAAAKGAGSDADYLELCAIVEQILPRAKSFAPWHYYLKVACILSAAVSLEVYIHTHKAYQWHLCALLGWLMALIGLNIQHDANHGAVSRNPWVNRVLGASQNWIGGSALDWIHQHVVQHHVNCNEVHNDPDIAGSDLLRLNPLKPLLGHQAGQHLYVFCLPLFSFLFPFFPLCLCALLPCAPPFFAILPPTRAIPLILSHSYSYSHANPQ